MLISAIITAHNEGDEVQNTIQSIRETAHSKIEVVLVNDASTDGCCDDAACDVYARNHERMGVAPSRLAGADAASGDCLIFMDAHHRFSDGCLDQIAALAIEKEAIVAPCTGGFNFNKPLRAHGAYQSQSRDEKDKKGIVGIHWINKKPLDPITRSYGAYVPYAIPRSVFPVVKWSSVAAGYGGNEASVAVRAYFAEINMLHLCGPWARHLFRPPEESPFEHRWPEWFRSHALTARICFAESTWRKYWYPHVFRRKIDLAEMNSEAVVAEHEAFQRIKRRSDVSFFRGLFQIDAPHGVIE